MPRVTCRCGEKLKVERDSPERINCPTCGAKIRLRRSAPPQLAAKAGDGFLRFPCPCGRRLKVALMARPVAGRCPDCGRVVPVPTSVRATPRSAAGKQTPQCDPEARTEELDDSDLAQLETWRDQRTGHSTHAEGQGSTTTGLHLVGSTTDASANAKLAAVAVSPNSVVKFEAGLRICPRCKKPIHLGATTCRECGTPVPRQ
jgi:hypothetical protein